MSNGTIQRICKAEGCQRSDRMSVGLCGMHYQRFLKHGNPLVTGTPHRADRLPYGTAPKDCQADGCGSKAKCKGLCAMHHARMVRRGTTEAIPLGVCSVDGCKRKYSRKGYCQLHFGRVQRTGDPGPVSKYPPKILGAHEYVFITVDGKQVMEHRYVMSLVMGRPLLRHENVHHINGNKHDNRPHNLELWSSSQPPGQRIDDKVVWAVELLALYAPHLLASRLRVVS